MNTPAPLSLRPCSMSQTPPVDAVGETETARQVPDGDTVTPVTADTVAPGGLPPVSGDSGGGEGAQNRPSRDENRTYGALRWIFEAGDEDYATFTAVDLKGRNCPIVGFHVTGRCPACTHETTSPFILKGVVTGSANVLVTVSGGGNGQQTLLPGQSVLEEHEKAGLSYGSIHCSCGVYHDGANENFGCGASWLIAGKVDLKHIPEHGPVFEPVAGKDLGIYWPAAEAVATAAPEALTAFRATAAAWQTGIAGLVTAVGLATLTAARTTIQGLEVPWNTVVTVAIIAATVLSAIDVIIALISNVGFPRVKSSAKASNLANADLASLRQAALASNLLFGGSIVGGLAFVAAFVALAAFIAVPDQGARDTKVRVVLYQATPTIQPSPSKGSKATPTVTPGTKITVTVTASPVCAIIPKQQPTPPAAGSATPKLVVVEPDSSPTPSQTVTIPVPSIAGITPGC
jgi:hypothetical protein